MNGVLIIDKPAGLTSHDVVNRVRRILNQRSVGHLGTLDPMATGVLPLVTGNFTRLAQFYTTSEKIYEGIICFGFSTDTYDAEGEPTSTPTEVVLQRDQIEGLAARFRGVIEQVPPSFSAKKIHGVPAYKLARNQKEVVLQPVQVEIKEFEIVEVETDRAHFRARVASGTYMRSVAHDMGQALGCGAHLASLRRTAVAEFSLADAHTLDQLAIAGKPAQCGAGAPTRERVQPDNALAEERPEAPSHNRPVPLTGADRRNEPRLESPPETVGKPEMLENFFIHPRKILPHFPCVAADEATVARIRDGRPVNLPELSRARQVKVFWGQRDLIAIATRVAGTLFHPKIVFSAM